MNIILCSHASRWHDIAVCVIRGSLKPEATHVQDIDVDVDVGEIQKVKFLWNNKVINLFRPKMGASQITVQSGKDGKEYVSDIPSVWLYLCTCLSLHPPILPIILHPASFLFTSSFITNSSVSQLSHLPDICSSNSLIKSPNFSSHLTTYPSDLLWKLEYNFP